MFWIPPLVATKPFSHFPFQILRNLLTNDPNNEATGMGADQVKAVCLFFQMCLESNFDDGNAIKLLGLLLIKFYNEQVGSVNNSLFIVPKHSGKSLFFPKLL